MIRLLCSHLWTSHGIKLAGTQRYFMLTMWELGRMQKNSQPVIRKDTDHATRSRDGIVFIRDIDKLIKKLGEIGIKKHELTKDGIYIFELEKVYAKSEIKEFRNTYYRKNEELFNMVAPKKVYPELRGLIVKALSMIPPKSKKTL